MKRQKFDEIVERYLAGKSTPEEDELLDGWANMHFRQFKAHSVFEESKDEIIAKDRIWKKIIFTKQSIDNRNRPWWVKTSFITGVAASLLIVLAFVYFLLPTPEEEIVATSVSGAETKNFSLTPQRITLPDGSMVVLETGASLVTDENYGEQSRTVYLNGEAFFDVQSNPLVPFFVYTGDLVTEVLGTSFRITSKQERNTIEVSVITGKVSVYSGIEGEQRKRNGVIATPNQKVIYDTELKTLRHDLTDEPKVIVNDKQKPDFAFNETPLVDVLNHMRNVYKIDIIVGNPLLNDCIFTGDLNGLDMYSQLDLICDVLGAHYEIRGPAVFVHGQSCNGF